jgi:hypothetical protein
VAAVIFRNLLQYARFACTNPERLNYYLIENLGRGAICRDAGWHTAAKIALRGAYR